MGTEIAGLLSERLTEGLPAAVDGAMEALGSLLAESCGDARVASEAAAAVESLDANFASLARLGQVSDDSALPVIPQEAVHWPREIASVGLPEGTIYQGYMVCGEYWWNEWVLPEIFALCTEQEGPNAPHLARRMSQHTFRYIRTVSAQAAIEYRSNADAVAAARPVSSTGHRTSFGTTGLNPDQLSILDEVPGTVDPVRLLQIVDRLTRARANHAFDPELAHTALRWFDSLCCTLVAARHLRIHRNTLLNRLRRIEELLDTPLDNDRLEIEIAIRLVLKGDAPAPDGLP